MDKRYRIQNVETIPSPSLVVYLEQVRYNIEHAVATVGGDVSKLRPHAKTHKTAEIIAMERDAGILKTQMRHVAGSRNARAERYRGYSDCLSDGRTQRQPFCFGYNYSIQRLISRSLSIIKNQWQPSHQQRRSTGVTVKVMLDLDVGMNRTGIPVGGCRCGCLCPD